MDIKFWIWLAVIVVTLIVRARKKQSTGSRRPETGRSQTEPGGEESQKPLSFEELLREIQASKSSSPRPTPKEELPAPAFREPKREETDYKPQRQEQYDIYEKAKQEAFFRPSLEETLKLEDTVVRFGQFKSYRQEKKRSRASEFANEIRSASGFRKAFIMSEILSRRF